MRRFSTLLLIAIVLGGLFRLTNLSGKVYWHDETYTALYATGHGNAEAAELVFDAQLKTAGDIMQMQTAVADRGIGETARQLAENDAQHPPLYYVMTRLVLYVLPNTVVASRLVAALAGLLLIPATYWLAQELFDQSLPATLSAAIVAVSPFQYLYAQEAREYSLWALTSIVASAALLRALKSNRLSGWLLYSLSIVIGLYGCILTALVIASHGLYVLWYTLVRQAETRQTETKQIDARVSHRRWPIFRNFALSSLVSLLLFFPWGRLITQTHTAKVSWTAIAMPFPSLAKIWAGNLTRLFFDLNLDNTDPLIYSAIPVLLSLALIGYALVWSIRNMPRPAFVFITLLGGVTLLTFVGPDLLIGGRRSSVSRYLIPTYLSLQLIVAYCLSQQLARPGSRTLGKAATTTLLVAGIISCTFSISADTWWHKKNSHHNPEVARIISQAPGSLLISSDNNANLGELFSLGHRLAPDQALLIFTEPNLPAIPQTADTLFLFNVSKQSREKLEQSYEVTPAFAEGRLWKMEPKS
ncbi:MAG: glycosyltransferase family 39 protein [Phormidesmis sp.]